MLSFPPRLAAFNLIVKSLTALLLTALSKHPAAIQVFQILKCQHTMLSIPSQRTDLLDLLDIYIYTLYLARGFHAPHCFLSMKTTPLNKIYVVYKRFKKYWLILISDKRTARLLRSQKKKTKNKNHQVLGDTKTQKSQKTLLYSCKHYQ